MSRKIFQIGDIVRLKSGEDYMVMCVEKHINPYDVICMWFVGLKLTKQVFAANRLVLWQNKLAGNLTRLLAP